LRIGKKKTTTAMNGHLANGYAAVVPVKIDMTAYDFIPELKKWDI